MVEENEQVALLKTIPGVGIINAATIAAYTADMERFEGEFKRFASYVGIVPGVHNSNESIRLGRITKHGPQELRTAFVQVALGMIRLTKQTSDWYLMFFTNTGKAHKIKAYEIPEASRTAKGTPAINFLHLLQRERITAVITVKADDFKEDKFLI